MLRLSVLTLLLATGLPLAAQEAPETPGRLDPERFHLGVVTDRSELAYEEAEAYYAILNHVRSANPAKLRQTASAYLRERRKVRPELVRRGEDAFPSFVDMLQDPTAWRGMPVTLSGHSLRVDRYAGAENEFGIDNLYEMWLVTGDSQGHPATIIFTEKPDDLPVGEELVDGIQVTGYFLKLHKYGSRDDKVRLAPMILAHTVRWRKPAPVQPPVPAWVAYLAVGIVFAVLIGIVWRMRTVDRAARARRLADSNQFEAPHVDESEIAGDDPFPGPPSP
ncbi:hypothetical protein [Maioricimonas rarisocia]|nr:hypothetical protein [Maioricimonas rarisocia]